MTIKELKQEIQQALNEGKEVIECYEGYEPSDEFGAAMVSQIMTKEETLKWVLELVDGKEVRPFKWP